MKRSHALAASLVLALAAPVACSTETDDAAPGGPGGGGTTTGPDGGPVEPPKACSKPTDCPSKVCTAAGTCAAPTATDGVKNGSETDIDCGGPAAPACDILKECAKPDDCTSKVCQGGICQAPTSKDGVKNGAESDVDCGGTGNPKCLDGKDCGKREDCESDVCLAGKCATPNSMDGVKNGSETDVDCGGPAAPRCSDALACKVDADCKSDVCKNTGAGLVCQVPSPTDGKKNGNETDVDCGGAANPACEPGKACLVGTDCDKLGCDYNKKCAYGRSCTTHYGGDTCGLGGAGGRGAAAWESCCATAPVTAGGVTVQMDKYPVTAGRMRVFLESITGNVRGFVQATRAAGKIPELPAGTPLLRAEWDLYLPSSFAGNTNPPPAEIADTDQGGGAPQNGIYTSVYRHLGGLIFRNNAQSSTGCMVSSPGTHAYWFPNAVQASLGDIPHEHAQTVYDTKGMNCIDYLVAQAFCIWDGGRLESLPEWQAAVGATTYPWGATPAPKQQDTNTYFGNRYPTADDAYLRNPANMVPAAYVPTAAQSIEYASYRYSYEYPNLIATDYIVFFVPPGRLKGRTPAGHADLLGNTFELTSTITTDANPFAARHRWSGNGSWEGHGYNRNGGGNTVLLNKYGKLGLRCVKP